jgi:thioredoxin 1
MALAITDATFDEVVLKSSTPVLVDFWAECVVRAALLAQFLMRLQLNMPENLKLLN